MTEQELQQAVLQSSRPEFLVYNTNNVLNLKKEMQKIFDLNFSDVSVVIDGSAEKTLYYHAKVEGAKLFKDLIEDYFINRKYAERNQEGEETIGMG